jgi:hypothetical protein
MTAQWLIEVESGIDWLIICSCGSQAETERMALYFRPMQCFSGREMRTRKLTERDGK